VVSIQDRADYYNKSFPSYPPLVVSGKWLYGVWMIGNDYTNATSYYGAYPHGYLKRVMSMFPDKVSIVHLFSGSLPPGDYLRIDSNPSLNPDICCDIVDANLHIQDADLILADPPYSCEDAEHYGTPLVNRNQAIKVCTDMLSIGGHLVWLDQVFPMYRKDELSLIGTIGLIRSTNHRVRTVFIWERI
jgi:hypothetical protein